MWWHGGVHTGTGCPSGNSVLVGSGWLTADTYSSPFHLPTANQPTSQPVLGAYPLTLPLLNPYPLQKHHLAREVFLMQIRDACSLSCVLRHAHVLTPRQFQAGGGLGEDVFVCEYQYDSAWQVGACLRRWIAARTRGGVSGGREDVSICKCLYDSAWQVGSRLSREGGKEGSAYEACLCARSRTYGSAWQAGDLFLRACEHRWAHG